MFGLQCGHLNKLSLIYLPLRLLQFQLAESMGKEEWAHLFWAVIVDSRQFSGTLTDAEDLASGVFPVSNLVTTRSIIQAHTVLVIQDTPLRCLPEPQAPATPLLRVLELGPAAGARLKTGERNGGGGGRGRGEVVGDLWAEGRESW